MQRVAFMPIVRVISEIRVEPMLRDLRDVAFVVVMTVVLTMAYFNIIS